MCDILELSRSGYYAWIDRPASASQARRAELDEQIRQVHVGSRGLYGSPRITAELREQGVTVTEKTVARQMRRQGLAARTCRRFRPRTTDSDHPHPFAPDRLDRDFEASAPNCKWTSDITYIPTAEGWLYLAVVIDLFSRRVVGWSMADHLRASLCIDALEMALLHRRPGPGLVHHSDRGVQYCCEEYQALLAQHQLLASMSQAGDCYDNAVTESFMGTLKQELVYQQPNGMFASKTQARQMIFEYLEVFYNRRRRHSAIGYVSPEAFEASQN
jgi:putative transposase